MRTTIHKFLMVFVVTLLASSALRAQQVTITGPSAGTSGVGPMGTSNYHVSEHIYTQAEITAQASGSFQIDYLRLQMAALGTNPSFGSVAVYMKEAAASTFVAGTYSTAGYTLVYSGPFVFSAINTWTGINLTTPFTYSNTAGQNLHIMFVRTDNVTHTSSTFNCAVTTGSTRRSYNSTVAPVNGTTALSTLSTFRAAVQFGKTINNDANVQNIYTLGKMPIEFGAPTIIQASIKNDGVLAQTNLNVTCNITGTNSYTDVQTIPSLAPGASVIVNFTAYSPTSLSTNDVVTVSVPSDDNNANNSKTWNMEITQNVYTYRNTSLPNAGGVGFTGATGDFVAKFNSNIGVNYPYNLGPPEINEVQVGFAAGGQNYQLGIWDATGAGGTPGALLWQSAVLTSVTGTAIIPVSPSVVVTGDYFVGVRQIGTTNVNFAYQSENPIRPQTFYFTSPTGNTVWNDFAPNSPFRFSIEVTVDIPQPPNCAIYSSPADASVVTCSAPDLVWGSGGGGPTGYNVYFSSNQTDVQTLAPAALVSVNQPGTTYTPSSLVAGTTYYWSIIPENSDGQAINCNVWSFTAGSLANCYCIPLHTNNPTCTDLISNVTINTLNNTTTCPPSAYTLFPASGSTTTTLMAGSTYPLSVTTDNNNIISVWIDYNQDGVFDATEWNQVATTSTANVASTLNLTIPPSALAGTTLMRIRTRLSGNVNGATDACTAMGSGESEDYVLTIIPQPPCTTPAPGATIASASSVCNGNVVNLSLQNATIGATVSYQWYSSPDNITYTPVGTNSATYSQSITANTYFYCDVTCSVGPSTASSTPVLVSLNAPALCPCTPQTTFGCTDGDVIAQVVLNTLNNNSGTGCPSGVLGYSDYTGLGSQTNLTAGNTYNCTVWVGQYSENFAAWIDYNDDGVFSLAERIGFTSSSVAGSGFVGVLGSSASFPITLNCSPVSGPHRLRVRAVFGLSNGSTIDPCALYSYSETEDYIITIDPALPCPAPSAMSSTVTSFTADLSWTAGCTETNWDLEYGPTGFTQGNGTSITATTNPTATISGLNCTSTYDVYYRANCGGANGTSLWVGPYTFSTLCCPQPGESFSNPVIIGQAPCVTQPYNNTVDNSTCYLDNFTGIDNQSSPDVWYQFTLANAATVEISLCASTFDTYLHLLDGSGNVITSNDDNGPLCTGAASSISTALAAGTYYIVTEGFGTATGNLALSLNTLDPCSTTLNVTSFIQGYYTGSSSMQSVLFNQNGTSPLTDCDNVTVELHAAPVVDYTPEYTSTAMLSTSGVANATFAPVAPGNYYIVLKHRNSLEVWSATAQAFPATTSYNFSAASACYTDGFGDTPTTEVESGIWASWSGDIDQDGYIDVLDYNLWDPEYQAGFPHTSFDPDLDGNGYVELDDYNIWDPNYQAGNRYAQRP